MTPRLKREFFEKYASGMAYVVSEDHEGNEGIGSAFHVGDGVFVTARHVVENRTVVCICAPQRSLKVAKGKKGRSAIVKTTHAGGEGKLVGGPYFHPNANVDVAALRVSGIDAAVLDLGAHLDDWLGTELVLSSVLLLGFPRIPFASDPPQLVAASGEVNAVVELYNQPNARFVISQMARGGFSGAPALSEYGFVLGVVTDSLVEGDAAAETGFCSVISVEPILTCLEHHGIMPKVVKKFWEKHSPGLFAPEKK